MRTVIGENDFILTSTFDFHAKEETQVVPHVNVRHAIKFHRDALHHFFHFLSICERLKEQIESC